MNLVLRRETSAQDYTHGQLWIDGEWFAYTLEDTVRELEGVPVAEWKQPGVTAIPSGRYEVVLTLSPRFQRELPLVVDVPGFKGVRIHAFNRANQSEGCIGPGYERGEGWIGRSAAAEQALVKRFIAARTRREQSFIEVLNPERTTP